MAMKITKFALYFIAGLAFLSGSQGARANLVFNGSFEIGADPGSFTTLNAVDNSIPGWTVTGGSVDYIGSYWQASNGVRSLDMDGYNAAGAIASQTFATVAGLAYWVSFDLAGNTDGLPTTKKIEVKELGESGK